MQNQITTLPLVSQANTVLFLLEGVGSKLAVVSRLLSIDGEMPEHVKMGAADLIEEARNTLYSAGHYGENVRDYLDERSKPLEISRTAMLKEMIDNADEKTANQMVLAFIGLMQAKGEQVPDKPIQAAQV